MGTLVVDQADAGLAGAIEAVGVRCVVAPTVMTTPAVAAELCRVVLAAAAGPGGAAAGGTPGGSGRGR